MTSDLKHKEINRMVETSLYLEPDVITCSTNHIHIISCLDDPIIPRSLILTFHSSYDS